MEKVENLKEKRPGDVLESSQRVPYLTFPEDIYPYRDNEERVICIGIDILKKNPGTCPGKERKFFARERKRART